METKQNIAENCIEYYSHEDFSSNYKFMLLESFGYDKDVICNRIQDIFNIRNYEVNNYHGETKFIDSEDAEKIHEFIEENFEEFTDTFSGYYVGCSSIHSFEFGEQHEQLSSFEDEDQEELKKQFEEAGYYVDENNDAYYNLDEGVHVDLCAPELTEFLKENNLLK
jgi:hypothetical protein